MSGIDGIIRLNGSPSDRILIRQMFDVIKHPGPVRVSLEELWKSIVRLFV